MQSLIENSKNVANEKNQTKETEGSDKQRLESKVEDYLTTAIWNNTRKEQLFKKDE